MLLPLQEILTDQTIDRATKMKALMNIANIMPLDAAVIIDHLYMINRFTPEHGAGNYSISKMKISVADDCPKLQFTLYTL